MKNKKRTFFENIKLFFLPARENKLIFIKGILVYLLWGINSVIHIIFLKMFTNYLELGNKDSFISLLFYYLGYILLYETIVFFTKKWGWVEIIPRSWNIISNKYLKNFTQLDNNIVELEGTGKLISIVGGGIKQWGLSIANLLESICRLIVSVTFAFFMVTSLDIIYGFIFLILFIFFSYISAYFSSKMDPYRRERNENINLVYKDFARIIMSKMEILQTSKINYELSKLNMLYKNDERINKEMSTLRMFMHRNADIGMGLFFIFSYYVLGTSYFSNNISLSVIVGFGGALILMQKSMSDSLSFYIQFKKDFVVIEKLWDFFYTTPKIKGYEEGKQFKHKKGEIEIKDLTYSYTKDKPIFKNFSLKISGEKITALVGNSGAGKSTLIKLIAGYIKPDSGEIIIDNQKLSETSLKSYYKDIGYLTQEPSVFDGSIYDNLTYAISDCHSCEGRNLLKDESIKNVKCKIENRNDNNRSLREERKVGNDYFHSKLKKIIKLSKCEFIYDLPNGLNTEIGERGVRLSGGQRQRLAIAKIMIKDPKVILLDEPTSALDSFSEELITKAMHNLFKGRTIIVIAHRLQTVKNADEIILIENGKIKERGTHKELISLKGHYKKMLDLQSGF